jgi:hypothetical protein
MHCRACDFVPNRLPVFTGNPAISTSYDFVNPRVKEIHDEEPLALTAFAQRDTVNGVAVDNDLSLLRKDLREEKRKLVALNVPLTEAEATRFWPVYDQYVAEMARHNDEFYPIVRDYVANQKQ